MMIHTLEIQNETDRWILAVSDDLHAVEKHKDLLLPLAMYPVYQGITELPGFPVFVIKSVTPEDVSYEYVDSATLLRKIASTKRVEGSYDSYFHYLIIDQPFFVGPENDQPFIQEVSVDNRFLESFQENNNVGFLFESRLAAMVDGYNIPAMDILAEYYKQQGTKEDRNFLAERGYISLFWVMCYDFACSKLTDYGVTLFVSVIERAESLTGKKYWDLRGEAFANLMEDASRKEKENVLYYAEQAIESYQKALQEDIDDKNAVQKRLAQIYWNLTQRDSGASIEHWSQAVNYVREAAIQSPVEAEWKLYLELLFAPFATDDEQHNALRYKERAVFKNLVDQLVQDDLYTAVKVAIAYGRLRETLSSDVHLFPENDYQSILLKAAEWHSVGHDYMAVSEVAQFFYAEGLRLESLDLLHVALRHYYTIFSRDPGAPMIVYYIAHLYETIGEMHYQLGDNGAGDDNMQRAWDFYREHFHLIKDSFSGLICYAEFLEKLYTHAHFQHKPTIEDVKFFATLAALEGKGHYSSPGFLLVRMSLLERDEASATALVIKELLLHELCIEDEVKALREKLDPVLLPRLSKLLDEAILFMEEVKGSYYYDPTWNWEQVLEIEDDELYNLWWNRMIEIRSRPQLSLR